MRKDMFVGGFDKLVDPLRACDVTDSAILFAGGQPQAMA